MRKAIFAACIGLSVVGCSSGGGALSAAEKSYTFTVNPKQGQTFNYDMTIGGAMNMNMSMSMTAEKVENGQTTFRSKIKSMTMNGQAMPAAANDMLGKMSIIQ